jgi:outer membrane protein
MYAMTKEKATVLWKGLVLGGARPAERHDRSRLTATRRRGATLTLEEAVALAQRNNPDYLQQANDIATADWAVRDAYGSLLPTASVSSTYGYTAAGSQRIGNFTGDELGLATDGLSYIELRRERGVPAERRCAARARPGAVAAARDGRGRRGGGLQPATNVVRQYLAVKRAQDGVELARQELARADENLRLAQARVEVGATIPMEAQQARGRAGPRRSLAAPGREPGPDGAAAAVAGHRQSSCLSTRNSPPSSSCATCHGPVRTAELAVQSHPQLRAARAAESAAEAGVLMARSAYLPSLSLSAGVLSGFARRAGNSDFLVQQARAGAESQRQSCTQLNLISAGLSQPLPGRPADCEPSRSRRTRSGASARATASTSRATRSPRRFRFRCPSSTVSRGSGRSSRRAWHARTPACVCARSACACHRRRDRAAQRRTGRRSAELEARNVELAEQQLLLARERYRLGAASYVELQEAETLKARADRAYLSALYQFHESLAALEAAVGRSLPSVVEIR